MKSSDAPRSTTRTVFAIIFGLGGIVLLGIAGYRIVVEGAWVMVWQALLGVVAIILCISVASGKIRGL